MLSLSPVERLHVPLIAPMACAAVAAFPLLGIDADDTRRLAMSWVAFGATAGALGWFLTAAWRVWTRRHDVPPGGGEPPPGPWSGRVLALAAGIVLGGCAGLYEDPEPFGVHLGAFCNFVLLPLSLLTSAFGWPSWRPFADIALTMVGAEAAGQLAHSYAKWGRLTWWDDISGINLAWFEGAMLVAVVVFLVTFRARRRRLHPADGETPPPRKAA